MRIFLIDPPGWQKHSVNLGLAYLAGALFRENIEVLILDLNNRFYSDIEIKKIINDFSPQLIGISIKTATANNALEILRRLKQSFPKIIYAVGGPHITLCGKEFIRENKEIDFGIFGEGESSLIELSKSIENNKSDFYKIGGICYSWNNNLTFNNWLPNHEISNLPFPRFEFIKDINFTNFRYPLLTSRGCPFNCIFCCVGLISGKKWRARSVTNVIEELIEAKRKFQITSFEVMDDNFTFEIERAKDICRLLIKERLGLDWWCHNGLRADKLDEELLYLMKKGGCKSIALGIESGDKKVFSNIQKGEKLSDIIKAVRMIQKVGIKCVGYFIIGLPGDSVESTKKTVKLQRRLRLSDYKYNMLVPYPGTKIWEIIKESGRLLLDIKETSHFGDDAKISFETDQLSKETLEQCQYLTAHQAWIYGEQDLKQIINIFKSQYQKGPKRIIFIIKDGLEKIYKNAGLEFKGAEIIEMKLDSVFNNFNNKYLIKQNNKNEYFNVLFRMRQEGYQFIISTLKRKLFVEENMKIGKEYKREDLCHVKNWANLTGRYFVTNLKYSTAAFPSSKNGVIYKDGLALAYSSNPEWENFPCGKIESGLAFISLPAYNPNSIYTTDYLPIKTESELRELIESDCTNISIPFNIGKDSLLEKVISESDILFFPQSLSSFVSIFSRAKMNVFYYKKGRNESEVGYNILEPCFMQKNNYSVLNEIKYLFSIRNYTVLNKIGLCADFIRRAIKVLLLWSEIILIIISANIRKKYSKLF